MKIYISGISGTGMGPLALMAKDAGFDVCGSDIGQGAVYGELIDAGIDVFIGDQDGEFLQQKIQQGIDWFIYTSALPKAHPELVLAQKSGIKCTKRDEFTAYLVEKLGLKMVAVAGTHGKTTTTSMIIYTSKKLGLPVSYVVGTNLGFISSGAYSSRDQYFAYEADEYDRNFLRFSPWLSVITSVSYDHPDIYPTKEDYEKAFCDFEKQSQQVIKTPEISDDSFRLAGAVRRHDAALAYSAIRKIAPDVSPETIIDILNNFPGVGRRFERLAEGIYTDYAHHPEEIAATLDVAKDEAKLRGFKGVVAIYQPHQNTRQHKVRHGYKDAFLAADKVFWLPTYLTRENQSLPVLMPEDLTTELSNKDIAESAELGDELLAAIKKYRERDFLVLLMTAGPADSWLRNVVANE